MRLINTLLFIVMLTTIGAVHAEQTEPIDAETLSEAELEQILAPIALYPDTVLSHILVAATYPLEVIQAERWTVNNPNLSGADAVDATDDMGWDPSVQALVAFPHILKRLSHDLNWTQKLGEAFLQDEALVLASIQSLRLQAQEAGNLDKLDKVSVVRDRETIIIEPVEREIIYLPYYDTRTVYGDWRWSRYAPIYWDCPYYSCRHSRYHKPFYWGPRVSVSFGFFFNSLHWDNRHIVRIPRYYYQPHRYYNRHDIYRHNHAQRWTHNPVHRRGVIYRNRSLRNHLQQQRGQPRTQSINTRVTTNPIDTHTNQGRVSQQRLNSAQRVLEPRDATTSVRPNSRVHSNTRFTRPEQLRSTLNGTKRNTAPAQPQAVQSNRRLITPSQPRPQAARPYQPRVEPRAQQPRVTVTPRQTAPIRQATPATRPQPVRNVQRTAPSPKPSQAQAGRPQNSTKSQPPRSSSTPRNAARRIGQTNPK